MAEQPANAVVRAHVVGQTDVGRVREHNEDSVLVVDRENGRALQPGELLETDVKSAVFLVVCDGMGGAAAGEVASRMASQRVADVLSKADYPAATPDMISSLMDQSVQQANSEIFAKAKGNSEMKGMGTTLTAAVVAQARLFVSQVGDSRAYLFRKGILNQITKDQSLIGQLIEEGTLTEEEAEKLGGRNIVLQAVGVEENLRVDTKHWPLLRGDVVLLCSDGLSGMVKDARMREILGEKGDDLRAAADALIAEANANGGRDNVTVVLGRFDGEGLRPPMETESGGIETAGAAFKAPPPPEVPNPMKKVAAWGGVLLAAIAAAFVAFRPTKAQVNVKVRPKGASVRLVGADGRDVATRVSDGGAVRIDDVEPGNYRLVVTAAQHFDVTQDLPILEHGVVDLPEVWCIPKPGSLTVSAADPDVTVTVNMKPEHPSNRAKEGEPIVLPLPVPGTPRVTENVPVGDVAIQAARAGFRPWTGSERIDPEERQAVAIPRLDEILGKLVLEGADGGTVQVVTAGGEPLVTDAQAQGASWETPVRAVKVRVRVTWKGYRAFEHDADVAEGARTVVAVKREADRVRVVIQGPAKRIVAVERQDGARWVAAGEVVIDDSGAARPVNLAPGRYRARPDGDLPAKEFDVAPGARDLVVPLGN